MGIPILYLTLTVCLLSYSALQDVIIIGVEENVNASERQVKQEDENVTVSEMLRGTGRTRRKISALTILLRKGKSEKCNISITKSKSENGE